MSESTSAQVGPARSRWIVTLSVVSAFAGMFMFGGWLLGGLVGEALGYLDLSALVGAISGAVVGVWLAAWLAVRLTGVGERHRRTVGAGIGGTTGFVAGLAIAALSVRMRVGLLPVFAMLAPGAGAAIGERLLTRSGPARS